MLRSIAPFYTIPACPSRFTQFNTLKNVKQSDKFIKFDNPINAIVKNRSNLALRSHTEFHFDSLSDSDWEFGDDEIEEGDDVGSPWEGAIMYERNAGVSHLEYCTTLERLGLAKVSSEVSRKRASDMGMRVVKSVKEYPDGTPVLISVDVSRRRQRLRLDGIVRTVLALNCNRCGKPTPQSVYSDFSLLLHEEPVKEPEIINMGVIFADEKSKDSGRGEPDDEDSEDALIDLDDQLYFPLEEKAIDISKNVRDLIHVEITISAVCDPNCKGLCLNCGANLNVGRCTCNKNQKSEEKGLGPLGDLRKRMASK